MAISSNPGPFDGQTNPDLNRIRRITFCVGSVKTAAHVVLPTGSKGRYDKVRNDSSDPNNISVPERNTYITEES
jgi:hypothetical protein